MISRVACEPFAVNKVVPTGSTSLLSRLVNLCNIRLTLKSVRVVRQAGNFRTPRCFQPQYFEVGYLQTYTDDGKPQADNSFVVCRLGTAASQRDKISHFSCTKTIIKSHIRSFWVIKIFSERQHENTSAEIFGTKPTSGLDNLVEGYRQASREYF